MNLKSESIKAKFPNEKIISTDDLFKFYQSEKPDIKKTTVNWRIYELVQNGTLKRIGRGKFAIGSSIEYVPEILEVEKRINSVILHEFPFIQYCVWYTSKLNEFLQHQTFFQWAILEVEKEVLDSVYHVVKDQFAKTYKKPSREVVKDVLASQKNSVVIKTLVSEAPLQKVQNIPTSSLEKMLVDVYCDKSLFYYVQGGELVHIYRNAFDKYTINKSKLLRYAARRQRKLEIDEFLLSIDRH